MGKQCIECGVKPKYSTAARCKECHGAKMRQYRKNPIFNNKVKAQSKAWRIANSEHERNLVTKKRHSIPAGIYGIFNDCKLIYIGESSTPYRRKGNHFALFKKEKHVKISSPISYAIYNKELQRDKLRFKMFEFIDDTQARKERELCLIQRYNPIYN